MLLLHNGCRQKMSKQSHDILKMLREMYLDNLHI